MLNDTNRDAPLEWHVVFDDGEILIKAADLFDGVMLMIVRRALAPGTSGWQSSTRQFLSGYRVRYEPEMDRARLVRR